MTGKDETDHSGAKRLKRVETVAPREYMGFLLFQTGRRMMEHVDAALAPLDLQARYIGILTTLEHEPLSQVALCARLRVDRTTMVGLVDEIERRGLVARRRDPHDRRAHAVTLTDAGNAVLREARAHILMAEEEVLQSLTVDERDQLHALLLRLMQPM